jgi:hypothetical protein
VNTYVGVSGVTLTATAGAATFQWLDCDNGFAIIPGATSASYTPTVDGNYAVEVTQNSCTDTSSCHAISGVGIAEHANEHGSILYDPDRDVLVIKDGVGAQALVYDLGGRQLLQQAIATASEEIPLRQLPAGGYVVKVIGAGPVRAMRFAKW